MRLTVAALLVSLALSAHARGGRRRAFKQTDNGDVVIYYIDEGDYPNGFPEDFPDDLVIMPEYDDSDPLPGFPSIRPPGEGPAPARDQPTPEEPAPAPPPAAAPPPAPAPEPSLAPPPPAEAPAAPPPPAAAAAPPPPQEAAPEEPKDEGYGAAKAPVAPPAAPSYPRRRASVRRTAAAKLAAAVQVQRRGGRCKDLLSGCAFWSSFIKGDLDPRDRRRRLSQDYCEASKADMHLYCKMSCGRCGQKSWGRRLRRRRLLRRRRVAVRKLRF